MFLFGVDMKSSFIFLITLFLAINSYADGPLQDIGIEVGSYTDSKELDSPAWFQNNPNLKTLFTSQGGARALFTWIGEGDKDFFRQENKFSDKIDYKSPFITYDGTFVNKEREELKIKIYVPHPKIASTIELGLNERINALIPPQLPVYFEKKISIKGIDGKLYFHKNKACSIILYFPANTILRTYKKECENSSDELIKFATGFDLNRLKLKLSKPNKGLDSNR